MRRASDLMEDSLPLVELLSDLVDETALDKPLDWESLNYESLKQVAILHAIELFQGMPHTQETLQLMATMAYLLIENTQLWTENMLLRRGQSTRS